MKKLTMCVAIAWMAAFWPMACFFADGANSAGGPSGPISLHFKRPSGEMLAGAPDRQRVVLETTRLHPPVD